MDANKIVAFHNSFFLINDLSTKKMNQEGGNKSFTLTGTSS